ncbi:hypothetical protein HY993_01915 [Candidatus Micrarchaeota archaeon]|nr:hypothetical protein [Candidatus Micrarchaeota archaeon]
MKPTGAKQARAARRARAAKRAQVMLESIILFCALLAFCSVLLIEKNSLEKKIVFKTREAAESGSKNASCSLAQTAGLVGNLALDHDFGFQAGECGSIAGVNTLMGGGGK